MFFMSLDSDKFESDQKREVSGLIRFDLGQTHIHSEFHWLAPPRLTTWPPRSSEIAQKGAYFRALSDPQKGLKYVKIQVSCHFLKQAFTVSP